MAKQLIFKDKYVQKLKKDLASGSSLEFYKGNDFVFDKKQVLMLPNIETVPGLVNQLDVNDDCKTAILIYEAFQKLEPIQASDERLWIYLAHADLYSYMIKRWNDVYTGKSSNPSKYISDHWFIASTAQGNLMRHAISGLWWSVYLSIDDQREDKYELTRVLFKNQTFRTRTFGNYRLVRHKEAAIGLLEFCLENENSFSNFEKEHQILTEHLNKIGGVKPLAYYDRHFFKLELEKVTEKISTI